MPDEEVSTPPPPTGRITLEVSDGAIAWESTFNLPEAVFWLSVLENMLLTKTVQGETVA